MQSCQLFHGVRNFLSGLKCCQAGLIRLEGGSELFRFKQTLARHELGLRFQWLLRHFNQFRKTFGRRLPLSRLELCPSQFVAGVVAYCIVACQLHGLVVLLSCLFE